ncbi:CdaR family transcriptional regulator [Bacillus sp. UNC438CL73TsuS30]|uniref:CdaR family transcriptional regulator n=1 Tax=Bacillus sp. UNC438CL73TsuS30 TaxID=1340434 RepID=UPI00047E8758|nr:sugar diacid recognition domain-containing protein [Bacillus sp. UNC438CL73TsuS30]
MIDRDIAQNIAELTTNICGYTVSIINSSGLIIGSGDKSRVNTIHEGLDAVFNNREYIEHDEEEVKNYTGAYEGVACPIVFNNQVIGAVGIRGNPKETKKYLGLVRNQVEMMYQQLMYFEIYKMKSEALDVFIQVLLSHDIEQNVSYLKSLAQINGYNLEIPRVALAIEIVEKDGKEFSIKKEPYLKELNKILKTVDDFFDNPQNILSKMGSHQLLVFKTLALPSNHNEINHVHKLKDHLLNKHGVRCMIGIGNRYEDVVNLKRSYQEAENAISIAKRMGETGGVFHIEEMVVGRIISEVSQSTRTNLLNNSAVVTFLLPENEILLDTFYSFCNNDLNLSKTARELNIHRNTLIYRISRIQALTGLDITQFHNATKLYLLLQLKRFDY